MPVKKKAASRTKSAKRRSSSPKRSPKKNTARARRSNVSRKSPRKSGAKIHQGVGLDRGAPHTGGLTRAAEKIGAAIGTTIGIMDSAVHSAAAFGAREVATAAHEVELLTKRLHTRRPSRSTRSRR
jgi:hypothetical protein